MTTASAQEACSTCKATDRKLTSFVDLRLCPKCNLESPSDTESPISNEVENSQDSEPIAPGLIQIPGYTQDADPDELSPMPESILWRNT
jgi:hypothetical protein